MKLLVFKAHGNDPLSFDIKALMRTAYSHAAMLIDNAKWLPVFIDLIGKNVAPQKYVLAEEYWPDAHARYIDPSEYASIDVFSIQGWDDAAEDLAMQYILKTIRDGVAYDVEDLFRFLAPIRAIIGEAKDDAAKRMMFCSYFDFETCKAAGKQLLNCHGFECSPDKLIWPMNVVPEPALTA